MNYKRQEIPNYMYDPNISTKAKVLFTIIINDAEGKYKTIDKLIPIMKEGRGAISSGINELIKIGYVIRIIRRDPLTKQFTKPDFLCNEEFTDIFYK